MTRVISIKEVMNSKSDTFSRKDNSVRGIETISKSQVQIGDKIVIDNYFTLVTE